MIKLYVGNLPYSYNEDSIRALFSDYGEIFSAAIILDRATNRSKGFGFVELDDAMGKKAIEEKNGTEVEGRNIVVNEARPREEGPRRSFGASNGGNRDSRGGSRDARGGMNRNRY
jgi:RNA recognition motif-containing protein